MKKLFAMTAAALLLAACGTATEAPAVEETVEETAAAETKEEVQTVGEYTIYNATGEGVTELYLYPTGSSDKGENLIDGAAEPEGSQVISFDAVPENLVKEDGTLGAFTLEYTTESGYTASFTTLSYEVAPLQLISADMVTGATQIKFGAPAAN